MRLWPRRKKRVARRYPVKRALLKIDGRDIEIVLRTNPRATRFIVKVDPATREVSVVSPSPSPRSLGAALDYARQERKWIAEHLAHVPEPVRLEIGGVVLYRGVEHVLRAGARDAGPVSLDRDAGQPTLRGSGAAEHAARRVTDWLKSEAKRRINERVAECAGEIGVKPKRVTLRDTSSRWGSCSSTRTLSFSWRLILAPPYVLDYVVAHEVAHLRELNHSARFWRLVESMTPHRWRSQDWLEKNGTRLHAYAPREARVA